MSIIRVPTRTKTKSFKGEQMDFKFPNSFMTQPDINTASDDIALNNHFLVNDTLSSDALKNEHLLSLDSSKQNISKANSSTDGSNYYSFANISDNTTSPSYFHSGSSQNDDIISMLHLNSLNGMPRTVAPKKLDTFTISKINTNNNTSQSVISTTRDSIPTADNISYAILSTESIDTNNLKSLRLPTNSTNSTMSTRQSSFIVQMGDRSSINHHNEQLSTRRGSSRRNSTVKRTPLNLYRKPTMRKVESIIFSSSSMDTSRQSSNNLNLRNNGKLSKQNIEGEQKIRIVSQKYKEAGESKELPRLPSLQQSVILEVPVANYTKLRKHSSYRANASLTKNGKLDKKTIVPKSNTRKSSLKRSNAIRCHGGLLQYMEQIGLKIKKIITKLIFVVRRKLFRYNKTPNSKKKVDASNGKYKVINKKQIKHHRPMEKNHKNTTHLMQKQKGYMNNLQRSISIRSLKPLLNSEETLNFVRKLSEPSLINKESINNLLNIGKEMDSASRVQTKTNIETKNNKKNVSTNVTRMNSIMKSPVINTNVRNSSTLRRTNSSIRRAASIQTSITPSTSTYYTSSSNPTAVNGNNINNIRSNNSSIDNVNVLMRATSNSHSNPNSTSSNYSSTSTSPVRKGRLVKSFGSNSLNSLVRQQSIVVKNQVIPINQYSSIIEEDEDESENVIKKENYHVNNVKSNNNTVFGTIKEEECEDSNQCLIRDNTVKSNESETNSSIFTTLKTENKIEGKEDKLNGVECTMNDNGETEAGKLISQDEFQHDITNLFHVYFAQVIQNRINMRVQMIKYQQSNVMDPHYQELIDSIIKNEDQPAEDDDNSSCTAVSDDDEMLKASATLMKGYDGCSSIEESDDTDMEMEDMYEKMIPMTVLPLHSSSGTKAVRRSMTLPLSIKI